MGSLLDREEITSQRAQKMKFIENSLHHDDFSEIRTHDLRFTEKEKELIDQNDGCLFRSGLLIKHLQEMEKLKSTENFSEKTARLRAEYSRILAGAGYPKPELRIITKDNEWRYAPDSFSVDDLLDGEALTRGATLIEQFTRKEPQSAHWYMLRIYEYCDDFIREKEAERKYDLAARIAHNIAYLELRLAHLETVQRGTKTLNSASVGGLERAQQTRIKTNHVLREMDDLINSGKDITTAAKITKQRGFGSSASANRKLWYKHRHKKM